MLSFDLTEGSLQIWVDEKIIQKKPFPDMGKIYHIFP